MSFETFKFIFVFYTALIYRTEAQSTTSLTPGTSGASVVEEVTGLIKNSGLFLDDSRFLIRIAYVESKFGTHPSTYRTGYHGGIWQVDNIGFKETQNVAAHPALKKYHDSIKTKWGINWAGVQWQDLRKPFYSGIAARLFLVNIPQAIPNTVVNQAKYWKKNYNSGAGAGTETKFINDVRALEG